MIIDLVQLRTFVAVAEEQHLTRAAERLHVSQSAASAHVRAIEESLDMQLFARTNRSLELTRAGQMLLGQAKALLNGAAEFTSFARGIRGKVEGNLIVGASSDPLSSRIGMVVADLRAQHPLITVDVCARASAGTRQALKTGEFDIGMLLGRPIDPDLTYYQLTTINFRVAGPVAWKSPIESAGWKALAELPWITPNGTNHTYAFMLDQLFGVRGLELNSVARFDNAALGRALVHAGVGMLLMHEEYALQGVNDGDLALSPIAHTDCPQYIAHVTSRENDPLIRAFIDAASEVWPDMKRIASSAND